MCRTRHLSFLIVGSLFAAAIPARAADNYTVDPLHSSVSFKVEHMGISMGPRPVQRGFGQVHYRRR